MLYITFNIINISVLSLQYFPVLVTLSKIQVIYGELNC